MVNVLERKDRQKVGIDGTTIAINDWRHSERGWGVECREEQQEDAGVAAVGRGWSFGGYFVILLERGTPSPFEKRAGRRPRRLPGETPGRVICCCFY